MTSGELPSNDAPDAGRSPVQADSASANILARIKVFLGRAYRLAAPYWKSPEHKKTAWSLLIALLAIEGVQLWFIGKLSFALADLMNLFDQRQFDNVWNAVGYWIFLMVLYIATILVSIHVKYHLIIGWRQFMTDRFLGAYVDRGLFHQLELKDYGLDNPDQRISEDTLKVAQETIDHGLGFISTIGSAALFGYILWTVGGQIALPIMGNNITIPGYMFWIAILYSIAALAITHMLGHPLIKLNYEQQAREADFRFKLVRLRENTEGIALLHGEDRENAELSGRFRRIRENWLELLKYQKRVLAINFGFGQLGQVFPYIAAMPAFIAGTVALGGFLQLRQAFGAVENAIGFFASRYDLLAKLKSNFDRLLVLEDAIENARGDSDNSGLKILTNDRDGFDITELTLELPTGDMLLDNSSFAFDPGSNVVITGESGSGKSTLFRAISGNWYWGSGNIRQPNAKIMFLPQHPYLPITSLKEALVYPAASDGINDRELREIMESCQMGKFVHRLHEEGDWARILSGGEKQRLSIVRAMIERPDWLFLDESTAAMDPQTEAKIYEALEKELPDTTLVSIAHRESLKKYHDIELRMEPSTKSIAQLPLSVSA